MSLTPHAISARFSTATDLPNFAGYTQRTLPKSPEGIPNPLSEFLPDDVFSVLQRYDLINEKALRDFLIRRDYRKFRSELRYSRAEAIEYLQERYPYLQGDTIRKIIYKICPSANRKRLL